MVFLSLVFVGSRVSLSLSLSLAAAIPIFRFLDRHREPMKQGFVTISLLHVFREYVDVSIMKLMFAICRSRWTEVRSANKATIRYDLLLRWYVFPPLESSSSICSCVRDLVLRVTIITMKFIGLNVVIRFMAAFLFYTFLFEEGTDPPLQLLLIPLLVSLVLVSKGSKV